MPTTTIADPVRLLIQKRLTSMLEEIIPANGYQMDLAGKVFRGRLVFGQGDPLPMLSILEAPLPQDAAPAPRDATESKAGWEIIIQGWVKDDKANPTDPAHVLMADVKQRLALERAKANWDQPEDGILGLGQIIDGMYIGQGVVRPPEEISSKAFFWLTITLDMAEDMAHPYEI